MKSARGVTTSRIRRGPLYLDTIKAQRDARGNATGFFAITFTNEHSLPSGGASATVTLGGFTEEELAQFVQADYGLTEIEFQGLLLEDDD